MSERALLILAGGASRRMGRDKATLASAEGETLLERLLRRLTPVVDMAIVAGRGPLDLRRQQFAVPVLFIPDRLPHAGPLSGIEAGISAAPESAAWVVACDLPDVMPEMGELLFRALNGYEAAVPVVAENPQPVCAVYGRGLSGRVAELLGGGKRTMMELLASLRVRYVKEAELQSVDPELRSFADLSTPSDYEAWLARESGFRSRPRPPA